MSSVEDDGDSDATVFSGSDSADEDTFHAVICDPDGHGQWIPPLYMKAKSRLLDVSMGTCSLADTCLACWEMGKHVTHVHPFFEGGICNCCKQRLLRTMFAKVDDVLVYCTICGSRSGSCLNCCKKGCARNYCNNCLSIWSDDDTSIKSEQWICFLCISSEMSSRDGSIPKAHPDWLQRILYFHEPLSVHAPKALKWRRTSLRVLSLFDGIGTGLIALRKLGISIQVYYASEVLVAAATVSRTRLGQVLQHVGSVGEVTRQKLNDISPIHLLIGGSPCNDFSAINRFPKDFYDPKGASLYFFDFVRVKNMLQEINGDQHLLWLFENVASMPRSYRDTLSKHLDSQPAVIDAKNFSPQLRRRLFWGNIPGLFTLTNDGGSTTEDSRLTLDQVLMPNSGRRAAQTKVRTLTTNTNSLLQGRTENCSSKKELASLFPVRFTVSHHQKGESKMPTETETRGYKRSCLQATLEYLEGEDEDLAETDVLWLQEIETVFGLPRHFTDVGNLSRADRQKLLGHAWSVPVIAFIFSSLKSYTLQTPDSNFQ